MGFVFADAIFDLSRCVECNKSAVTCKRYPYIVQKNKPNLKSAASDVAIRIPVPSPEPPEIPPARAADAAAAVGRRPNIAAKAPKTAPRIINADSASDAVAVL